MGLLTVTLIMVVLLGPVKVVLAEDNWSVGWSQTIGATLPLGDFSLDPPDNLAPGPLDTPDPIVNTHSGVYTVADIIPYVFVSIGLLLIVSMAVSEISIEMVMMAGIGMVILLASLFSILKTLE